LNTKTEKINFKNQLIQTRPPRETPRGSSF